jgi:hypothetical protein
MNPHSAEFRRCLVELDVAGIRALWRHTSPHLAQPKTDAEALVTLHHARTQADSVALKLRAYSHRWLLDNGFPSGLPDRLKPSAERIYPRVVESVGISVNFRSAILKPIGKLVRGAMENAVLDAYAEKRTEPEFLRARMTEARETAIRKLVAMGLE